jgi:hypothetical protein
MFARAPSPAFAGCVDAPDPLANTMLDPVVMALPGALPGLNRRAVELSMLVGLALNCSIAGETKWDRKGYTYPDLPKGYQISQYDLPLCYDGSVDVPALGAKGAFDLGGEFTRVGIMRAHLEEDAGKLSHEAPGGGAIDGSLVDLNRAGTPLLEIVTAAGSVVGRSGGRVLPAAADDLPVRGRDRGRDAAGAHAVRAQHQLRADARGGADGAHAHHRGEEPQLVPRRRGRDRSRDRASSPGGGGRPGWRSAPGRRPRGGGTTTKA